MELSFATLIHLTLTFIYSLFTETNQGRGCLKSYLKLQSWDLNLVAGDSGPEREEAHMVPWQFTPGWCSVEQEVISSNSEKEK